MADRAPEQNERDSTHLWVDCPGCRHYGKIGVPRCYSDDVIACPKCRQVVRIRAEDRVLWRPSRPAASHHAAVVKAAAAANGPSRKRWARESVSAALDNDLVQFALIVVAAVVPMALAILLPIEMHPSQPGDPERINAGTQAAPTSTVPGGSGALNAAAVKRVAPGAAKPPPSPPGADEIYRRAKHWLAKGDYAAAICDFDDVLRSKPEFVWCFYYRAGAYSRMGNQNAALTDLDRATVAMPAEAKVWRARAVVYHRQGNLTAAVADIHRAVELAERGAGKQNPDFATLLRAKAGELLDELYEQATANLKSGRCRAAIAKFSDVLRRRPQFASAWLRRAAAYDATCQYDKALYDLNIALHLRAGPAQAFKLRSVLHERRNDYAKALADMRMAQRLDPRRADDAGRVRWLVSQQVLYNRSRQVATPWRRR